MHFKTPETGIVPDKPRLPAVPQQAIASTRTHNGLPLLTQAEFQQYYHMRSDDTMARTFIFQGYVENEGGVVFADVIATTGVRGIHVGIDGVVAYHAPEQPANTSEVKEYVVYVTVPPEVQKKEGVVCQFDSCKSEHSFRHNESQYMDRKAVDEEVESLQSQTGWIVVRLPLEVQEGTREQVRELSLAINRYLTTGGCLEGLEDFICEACDYIKTNRTPESRRLEG